MTASSNTLQQLQTAAERWLIPSYKRFPVQFVKGEGCWLTDSEGNRYLDFLSGISVCNTGHCHPQVVQAVQKQVAELMHITNLYYSEPMVSLAQRLAESSLGGKVYFSNSGAEANEAAIKLARKARPGGEIVVLEQAFHGRTYGALSATPQPEKQLPFAPLVPGFKVVPKDDPTVFDSVVGEQTAAVIIEPIQGETGVNLVSDELLVAARAACDRSGAALIFDEIQCGMGRTGSLWAYQQTPVTPDAITVAKGLGGGMPIGALITNPALANVFEPGDHGSTFAGGPVVAAAANAAFDLLSDHQLLSDVKILGDALQTGLKQLPGVKSVRGRGLMIAFELATDAPTLVQQALSEQRLIINATGPSTVRLLPPLIIDRATLDEGLNRLQSSLDKE